MALSPGERLGPYEIVERIGQGGMGEVYKGRDTRLNRLVAIKQLKGQHSARFQQEAQAIAALNHPHICQIYDVGPDYLVLEYVDGSPIQGPMPAPEAIRLALQIVSAIEEAHKRGILHRDLKPGNILLTAKGAKLLDFGLAKLTGDEDNDATRTIGVSGTPVYMSPEQAEGQALDARSDIFSFGAVLYELLAGSRAFDSLAGVLRDEPRALDSPLSAVVKRCLAKDPAQRFQSAAEVRAALAQLSNKPADQQPSIAVLPFANMSADKDNEYFSDGLAEEILNLLAKIPELKVIARTSSFAFRGKEQDIRGIGQALDVGTVLEGSVRRAGNRIRVTAQLINVKDGAHLWSERYDRQLEDVFAVQDEIAAAISTALQTKLSKPAAAKPRYVPKLAAHEALMKGWFYHWKMTPEAMGQAKAFFEQAVALDSQYALAHSSYADHLIGRAVTGIARSHDVMPQIRTHAQNALALDPSLPEAHAVLGMLAATYDYDWTEAERKFSVAMASEGIFPWARSQYAGAYLLAQGRYVEAVEQAERAVQSDPLHPLIGAIAAMCLTAAGRIAEGEVKFRELRNFHPTFVVPCIGLASLSLSQGRLEEALQNAETAYAVAPPSPQVMGALGGLLARVGEVERAEELRKRLSSLTDYQTTLGSLFFYTFSGDLDRAAEWCEKAIEERSPSLTLGLEGPVLHPLRTSSHWPRLAKLMNLPA